jgi:hypothetical protein
MAIRQTLSSGIFCSRGATAELSEQLRSKCRNVRASPGKGRAALSDSVRSPRRGVSALRASIADAFFDRRLAPT